MKKMTSLIQSGLVAVICSGDVFADTCYNIDDGTFYCDGYCTGPSDFQDCKHEDNFSSIYLPTILGSVIGGIALFIFIIFIYRLCKYDRRTSRVVVARTTVISNYDQAAYRSRGFQHYADHTQNSVVRPPPPYSATHENAPLLHNQH